MSLAKRILPVLPRLRRFGQMLMASSTEVDHVIRTCLREIIVDPKLLSDTDDVVTALFKMFLERANSGAGLEVNKPGAGLVELVNEFLSDLSFVERQTFLLRFVEGFGRKQTAVVMGLRKKEVKKLEKRLIRKLPFK